MNLLPHIRTLEKAAGVEPATTRDHYRETTEEERKDYMRWLSRQAPITAGFLPTQVFNWMFSIPTPMPNISQNTRLTTNAPVVE